MEHLVESPESLSPIDANADPMTLPIPPKLSSRRRLLQRLQKMSSSESLRRSTRGNSHRSRGLTSMSCITLSSAAIDDGYPYGSSYNSQLSAGFSTAPTSVVSTPGADMPFFDSKSRIRRANESTCLIRPLTPATAPVPADVRFNLPSTRLGDTPAILEERGDYFSLPIANGKAPQKRRNVDHFGTMPNEIKMHILQFLEPKQIIRCSRVSREWHKMCFDGQLWTVLDATKFYRNISSASLVKLISAGGPFLKALNLRGCLQMEERWGTDASKMIDLCTNIETLFLEGTGIEQTSFHYFLLRSTRLVRINVMGTSNLNDTSMKLLAVSCPLLETLEVSWCKDISGKGLRYVVQACSRLKDLRASETSGWNDKAFLNEIFLRNTLERIVISHCTGLSDTSLQILFNGSDPQIDHLTGLAVVPPRALRHIDISRNSTLSDAGVSSIARNTPLLTGLQLSNCRILSDASLTPIIESSPLLTHLDLEGLEHLTNALLSTLAKSACAPYLEHLCISYCEGLGDTGMLPVVKRCGALKSVWMDNTRISDLVLVEIAAQVRRRNRAALLGNPSGKPCVGIRVVAYDCQHVNWTGVREVLSRNAEFIHRAHESTQPNYPKEVVSLKCFYGYQPTVDEHTKRVLRGELVRASMLEKKWAEYMLATEEAGAAGAGARRRRRRAREAALVHADEEDGVGRGGRRRARSGGCAVM